MHSAGSALPIGEVAEVVQNLTAAYACGAAALEGTVHPGAASLLEHLRVAADRANEAVQALAVGQEAFGVYLAVLGIDDEAVAQEAAAKTGEPQESLGMQTLASYGKLLQGSRSLFELSLASQPTPLTLDQYAALCKSITPPIKKNPYHDTARDLFRYFGNEALAKIFPAIRRQHVRIEYGQGGMSAMDPEIFDHLPAEIDGVPIEDIVGYIGNALEDMVDPAAVDRIKAADGNCSLISVRGLQSLVDAHPRLYGRARSKRIGGASRRAVAGEYQYPGLRGLSDGHTIITIPYTAADGEPMVLAIDPSIAQVDRTEAYDLEVTALPAKDADNYLRLRYRANSNSPVYDTYCPPPRSPKPEA